VEQHPFEIEEFGWGEFTLKIQIFFLDPKEAPVSLTHHIRLYHDETHTPSTKPVNAEVRAFFLSFLLPLIFSIPHLFVLSRLDLR
jgi:transcription initiation factor IIF auxiliary subunit